MMSWPSVGAARTGRRFVEAAALQQGGQALHARDVPHRTVAMTRERSERAGVGEAVEIAPVEHRAAREIGHVGEGGLPARGHDAFRTRFATGR